MIYNSKIVLVHFPNKFHNYTCHDQCKQACKMVFSLAKFFIFGRKCPNVAARDNTCNHCRKWFKLGMEAYNGHELSPQKSSVDLRYVNKPSGIFGGCQASPEGRVREHLHVNTTYKWFQLFFMPSHEQIKQTCKYGSQFRQLLHVLGFFYIKNAQKLAPRDISCKLY